MLVSEVMHKRIRMADINDSVRKVAEIMREEEVNAVPVLDQNKPIGFVTERDIVVNCVAEGHNMNESISHAINEDIVTVSVKADTRQVQDLLYERQVTHALVLDENDFPVGTVSLQDLQ